ncbi:hypothetical protein AVEN_167196-1 [Araneus ventricosus]|uniref:Tc1-like transposase DDE domain-containing protein n=1 Tax=Araneus ventricosus TaxID=182803 RepID=A0A4Y2FMR3_ARAVE|nr:hypothetical protein AVEN_167196-1 [Araneus ventricosus]
MFSAWLFPQLEEAVSGFILQLDGAPPHWHNNVREYLNDRLPHRWIGRAVANDLSLLCWPPRFPYLTPCDFSSGVLSRTKCLCLHFLRTYKN